MYQYRPVAYYNNCDARISLVLVLVFLVSFRNDFLTPTGPTCSDKTNHTQTRSHHVASKQHTAVQATRVIQVCILPVAAVAGQVILEPGIGQFREFESPRVHTRTGSWGFFLRTN